MEDLKIAHHSILMAAIFERAFGTPTHEVGCHKWEPGEEAHFWCRAYSPREFFGRLMFGGAPPALGSLVA